MLALPHKSGRQPFPLFYAHFLNHWHSCLLFTPASHTSLRPGFPFPFLHPSYCDCSVFHPCLASQTSSIVSAYAIFPLLLRLRVSGRCCWRAEARGWRRPSLLTRCGATLDPPSKPPDPCGLCCDKHLRPCCFVGSPRLSTALLSLPGLEMEISHTGFNSLRILTAVLRLLKVQALTRGRNEAYFLAPMLLHACIHSQQISVFLLLSLICSYFGPQP